MCETTTATMASPRRASISSFFFCITFFHIHLRGADYPLFGLRAPPLRQPPPGGLLTARFYLRNCPGVKIDGDHDGIPCEVPPRQCS
ncbi:excalibur calcium-binding domain-containing protein [Cupriavidus basilensis]|uniref:excalibur calcium-binding domain-containing protein n=1 Tax=Cupriavidus basilensis TaxID=68895 RepID=UPI000A2EF96C